MDAAVENANLLCGWPPWIIGLVLLKAVLAWLFRTGQFRASSEAKLNVRDQIYKQVVKLGPGLLGKRRTGEIAGTATEGVEYLDYYFGVYFVQIWVAIAIPIFFCAAIFWIDWVVGLWMLAGVPLTPLFSTSSSPAPWGARWPARWCNSWTRRRRRSKTSASPCSRTRWTPPWWRGHKYLAPSPAE